MVLIDFLSSHHLPLRRSTVGKKLYVGNLAFSATESSINDLFSQYGTVDSCRLITDRDTGRSKGFGFVEMSSDEEAEQAISTLNGYEMDGRALTVNEARPQAPRSGGYGGGGGGGRSFGGGDRGGFGSGGSRRGSSY
jgi:cold-inducible RNA-binding protein